MKVGIVTVTHQSENLRPYGLELVTEFINSLKCLKYEYECIVIDNSSTVTLNLHDNIHLLRIEDQLIYGLTGAWEIGLQKAIELGCNIIIINNDDLIYNETVNSLITFIISHSENEISLYGPVSKGILGGKQLSSRPINQVIELTNNTSNMLNGFMFAFTDSFYHKFKKDNGELFNKELYPWGGNEEEFQKRIWKLGGKSFIIGQCWIDHKKLRGWKQFSVKNNNI